MYDHEKNLLEKRGYVTLDINLYNIFRCWKIIEFVEKCYNIYNKYIVEKLEELRYIWDSNLNNNWVRDVIHISKYIDKDGLRVWVSNLPSVSQHNELTGPRFYVSVDNIWKETISNIIPPIPEIFNWLIDNKGKCGFLQNMGWTLVPPNSNVQILHQDRAIDGCYHILWKDKTECITTELVPYCFDIRECNHSKIIQDRGQCILFKSALIHRGSNTLRNNAWSSTFSIEFRTTKGQKRWDEMGLFINDKDWEYMTIKNNED